MSRKKILNTTHYSTCIHEASHAIIALTHNIRPKIAKIESDTTGYVDYYPDPTESKIELACIYLAGIYAEEYFCNHITSNSTDITLFLKLGFKLNDAFYIKQILFRLFKDLQKSIKRLAHYLYYNQEADLDRIIEIINRR